MPTACSRGQTLIVLPDKGSLTENCDVILLVHVNPLIRLVFLTELHKSSMSHTTN